MLAGKGTALRSADSRESVGTPSSEHASLSRADARRRWLKWGSLATLVAQNSSLFLTLRLSRAAHDDAYAGTVAVLVIELLKLGAAFALLARQLEAGVFRTCVDLWSSRRSLIVLSVPALCYMLQQNFLFIAAESLSAPALQIIGQSKTLWTALFASTILRQKFTFMQITSFGLLFGGVVLVQQEDEKSAGLLTAGTNATSTQALQEGLKAAHVLGVTLCLAAAALSGFAGIFLEKVYIRKGSSLWALNVHLAALSLPMQLVAMVRSDGALVREHGLFAGFHYDTWAVILIQAFGGLLTGVVIKYAGNVLKGYANAIAILTTCVSSMVLFKYLPTALFMVGLVTVCISTVMYAAPPLEQCVPTGRQKVKLSESAERDSMCDATFEMNCVREDSQTSLSDRMGSPGKQQAR
ncbi:hypothetical protein AB1Y20_011517 [Prymnesium parvum]|uniref:UDP-galactose transporter n=1 Tax=Prymnesium parvum TaxID=97485 RepID=A0AB34IGN7_PRYPA